MVIHFHDDIIIWKLSFFSVAAAGKVDLINPIPLDSGILERGAFDSTSTGQTIKIANYQFNPYNPSAKQSR
jgi:hypothetical protein